MRTGLQRFAVTVVVLLAAACGNDNGSSGSPATSSGESATVSATDYANGVCTAINDWVTAIQDGEQQYQDSIPSTPDPSNLGSIKDSLVAFVDDVVQETSAMMDQIRALGTPEIDGGDEVRQGIEDALQSVQDAYTKLQQDIQGLNAENPTEMVTKLQTLSTELQQASSEIQAAFQALDENVDMKAAGENAPACQELGNAS